MVGKATLTTVPSSMAMLDPSTVAASTQRPCLPASRIMPGASETTATTRSSHRAGRFAQLPGARPAGRPAPGAWRGAGTGVVPGAGAGAAPGEGPAVEAWAGRPGLV